MKKLLVLLLALTIVGIFAYADDAAAPTLTINAKVQTGLQIYAMDKPSDMKVIAKDSDSGAAARTAFTATISGTLGGAKTEWRMNGFDAAVAASLPYAESAFAWWKPVSMLKFQAGKNYDVIYEAPVDGWDNGQTGAQVRIDPITGLAAGFDVLASSSAVTLDVKNFAYAASYTMANVFTVGANVNVGTKIYIAGLKVVAVPNLTIAADLKYDDSGAKPVTGLKQKVTYVMGPLTAFVRADEDLSDALNKMMFRGNVAYALATITPALDVRYYTTDATGGDNYFKISPCVDIKADKNTVRFYFDYQSDSADGTAFTQWDVGIRMICSL